jgi:hypothetical protein
MTEGFRSVALVGAVRLAQPTAAVKDQRSLPARRALD